MDESRRSGSLLDTLGEEIIRIIVPVSVCMFAVVLLVVSLSADGSSSAPTSPITMATALFDEPSSDFTWNKLEKAVLYALVFVCAVTFVTFILVFLFYLRCTKFLKLYMALSSFVVLLFMGGEISLAVITKYSVPVDPITFLMVLYNFSAVGMVAVSLPKMPILVTQAYLVVIGVLVAYWFTMLPEWTTWILLVSMALYDLAAVLLPVGPLRLLVELSMSRDEDIPALVYESRPVTSHPRSRNSMARMVQRENPIDSIPLFSGSPPHGSISVETLLDVEEDRHVLGSERDVSSSLMTGSDEMESGEMEIPVIEGIGLGSSGGIKLGLGDFIFYSVLVGRAAMYDLLTVFTCFLSIIAGLSVTLVLLGFYRRALPALPVSVMLGVLFYFLTRFLLEIFVVEFSMNLLLF